MSLKIIIFIAFLESLIKNGHRSNQVKKRWELKSMNCLLIRGRKKLRCIKVSFDFLNVRNVFVNHNYYQNITNRF